MATQSERDELNRLSSGSSTLVNVLEFPKLADILGPKIPYAMAQLREWDEKVEVWRRSVLAARTTGGSIPAPPTPP